MQRSTKPNLKQHISCYNHKTNLPLVSSYPNNAYVMKFMHSHSDLIDTLFLGKKCENFRIICIKLYHKEYT